MNEPELFNDEERVVMDLLAQVLSTITTRWCLRSNGEELTQAIHVVQGYVQQHALAREYPREFRDWWGAGLSHKPLANPAVLC